MHLVINSTYIPQSIYSYHQIICYTNCKVEVIADQEKSTAKGADFFKEFDLVIATACPKVGTGTYL